MTSHLKKVSYKKFNKEVVYFYDDEENYIIENKNDKEEYLKLVFKSDNESQDELDKLMNKNFIQVTYLSLKTYISVE